MTHTTLWRRAGGTVAAAAAVLILSACGGSGGDGVASAGGEQNAANPAETGPAVPQDPDAQALDFAGCMRENGVDMPDPGPGQQGMSQAWQSIAGNHDRATLDQAVAACQEFIPQYPGQEDHGTDEWQLALAECLREQGLDVSDNVFNDLHSGQIDQDELAAAMEACRNVITGTGE
jgi:hypothetical protein